MRHPPFLPSLFAVVFLSVVNLKMKAMHIGEVPPWVLLALVAVIAAGAALQPFVLKRQPQEVQKPREPQPVPRADDDLDLSA